MVPSLLFKHLPFIATCRSDQLCLKKAEAETTEQSTTYTEWRAQLLKTLAVQMAALRAYEDRGNPSEDERTLRKGETKAARLKIYGVSQMIYDWSHLHEESKQALLQKINAALEEAEKETSYVV